MPFLSGYGQQTGQTQPQMLPQVQPSTPGLLANPSAFQFLDAMMNQPGGFNQANIPGFGTQQPFGMPMYLPPTISPRTLEEQVSGTVAPPATVYPTGSYGGGGGHQGSER